MNILTFDIEDWYCHDVVSCNLDWDKHEVRIYEGVDRILAALQRRNQQATFFCLGWVAKHHPRVVKKIFDAGHQIGCHSFQHELATRFDRAGFRADTEKAKKCIEDVIGQEVSLFRAPVFSITCSNLYVLEILAELGFSTDCSLFPATRDYGGLPDFGCAEPAILSCRGMRIKEFPINVKSVFGQKIVFSGGGYFRLLPYVLIKSFTRSEEYVMTYFHPSDFDPGQPELNYLPLLRRWKNRVGLRGAFAKFEHYLDDFEFMSIAQADREIDWGTCNSIHILS